MSTSNMPDPTYLANENKGPSLRIFIIILASLSLVSVALRFYSRFNSKKHKKLLARFWWDDWTALLATFFMLTFSVLSVYMIHLGFGKHVWSVPPKNVMFGLKLMAVSEVIYDIGLGLIKTSALLFYSRVFPAHNNPRWFNISLIVTHSLNAAWVAGLIMADFLLCRPVAKAWDPSLPGSCGSTGGLWMASAILSVLIDMMILILPLPIIWTLNMDSGRKIAVTGVFVCAYCALVISIGRVVVLAYIGNSMTKDFTYAGMPMFYWLTAEMPVTLISICLPAMSQLGRQVVTGLSVLSTRFRGSMMSQASTDQSMTPAEKMHYLSMSSEHSAKPTKPKSGFDFRAPGYHAEAFYADTSRGASFVSSQGQKRFIFVKNKVTVKEEV